MHSSSDVRAAAESAGGAADPRVGLADPGSGLDDALRLVDDRIAAAGTDVWVGSEPTFTSRFATDPAWTYEALGGDKEERAGHMLVALAARRPAAVVLRPVGRQYPHEPVPRWCLALYERRDGRPLWSGPADPLLCAWGTDGVLPDGARDRFADSLAARAARAAWSTTTVWSLDGIRVAVALRADGAPTPCDGSVQQRADALPLHLTAVPPAGLADALAADGTWVVVAWCETDPITGTVVLAAELPAVAGPEPFATLLRMVGEAATEAGLAALILRGHPPPVDGSVALTTLTPDPAVLEVNHAPASDGSSFARAMREVYAAASDAGLEPYRLQFDGSVVDSGGAGHLTLGGPSAQASPFFVAPRLLPRLVRYLNRHPALSYWFCRFPGGCGQSPRTDEGTRETFAELELALARLDREAAPEPSLLARTIAPFLVDPSGNPHRSELNVEKLWNDLLPGRGRLGLVEFRAFGMARSADVLAARACLLRALAAMLARVDVSHGLERWGDDLHDRFALPFHLRRDLLAVTSDLAAAGLALPPAVLDLLLADEARVLGCATIDGVTLEIEQAVEFWPLVGDVASQEGGGSRLVDASTVRLQLLLRVADGARTSLHAWHVGAEGYAVRLQDEHDARGPLKVGAVRYRSFVPAVGLHPAIPALPRLRLTLQRSGAADGLEIEVHGWRPDGAAYDGLPADLDAAAARRRERVIARRTILETPLQPPPGSAMSAWALDLRAV